MHIYTPLAESDSTEASTMHGVRSAVACSVHGDQCIGSLRFVVSEFAANAQTCFPRSAKLQSHQCEQCCKVSQKIEGIF